MSIFKYHMTFEMKRGLKFFLNLEAGVTRGEIPESVGDSARVRRNLRKVRRQLADREEQLAQVKKPSTNSSGAPGSSVHAENIIWIFGMIRTGSTWLGSMMGDLREYELWNEPRVGELFGYFFYERAAHRRENKNFILGLQRKHTWLKSIRTFVLDSVAEAYPGLAEGRYLIIKEPSGSIGSPLLSEALPESRMIFLVRDPRDVVASSLDTAKKGSWAFNLKGNRRKREALSKSPVKQADTFDKPPDRLVKEYANMYRTYVGNSKQAYEAHEGPKIMVRYEDLLVDTLGTMKRIFSTLEVEVDEVELARVVEKHSWENIPEEKKGEGKFYRKAAPGGWEDDLSLEQVRTVEEITGPLLKEFYSG